MWRLSPSLALDAGQGIQAEPKLRAFPLSSGGNCVNFLGADEPEERVRAAYGQASYDRLRILKAKHDPRNLFRVNQNIRPAA